MSALPGRLVLIGYPVAHSLSPVFQNAALDAAAIPLRYEALEVTPNSLRAMMGALRDAKAAGNVTVPHKEAVASLCDELTPIALRIGAVNCFVTRSGRLIGHNTDVDGVRDATRTLLGEEPRDLVFGVIGAGGAAAAVLAAVESWSGCSAIVANRGTERLRALTARFVSVARAGDVAEFPAHIDIVVNATSLGLRDEDALAIEPRALRGDCAVLDLVYSKNGTRLVREAAALGLRAADGLAMLIAQGAAAFEWWFHRPPDLEVMWRSVGRPQPDSRQA